MFDAKPSDEGHILVYFTQEFETFMGMLREFPRERFLVYGAGREGEEGNMTFRPFSSMAFWRIWPRPELSFPPPALR